MYFKWSAPRVTHLLQVPVIQQLSSTQASHYNGEHVEIYSDLPDLSDFPLNAGPLFIAVCWTWCALPRPLPKSTKSSFSWCQVSCKMQPQLQPELFYFASFAAEASPALKTHLYYHGYYRYIDIDLIYFTDSLILKYKPDRTFAPLINLSLSFKGEGLLLTCFPVFCRKCQL